MGELRSLFLIYMPQGILKALWTILRIVILPYDKLNRIIPNKGNVLDIGCGNGGFTNYIVLLSKERKVTGIDLSKERISQAVKSIGERKNIKFIFGDVVKTTLPKANCYLMIDMLHHISFKNQEKLLRFLVKKLDKKSILIIKEVDPSNRIAFLLGHAIEKILYPKETIYTRSKKDWEKLFLSLGLSIKVISGAFYFPDSTKVYVLTK